MLRPTKELKHSAKGSTWEKHDYIKVEDGKYYYPDDYEGGRHLPKGDKDDSTTSPGEPSGWENQFYKEWESNLNRIGQNLDPKQVQEMLLFGKNSDGSTYDNFYVALTEMGIDADKIDPNTLNKMRYKVVEHYKKEFEQEKDNFDKAGNRTKQRTAEQQKKISGSSSSKKSSTKKSSSKATVSTKKETSKSAQAPKNVKQLNSSSYWADQAAKKKKKSMGQSYMDGVGDYIIAPTPIHW